MGSQKVRHDWVTNTNITWINFYISIPTYSNTFSLCYMQILSTQCNEVWSMSAIIKTDVSITPKVPFQPLSIDPHPSWAATVLICVIKTLLFLNFHTEWTESVCVSGFFLLVVLEIHSRCQFSSVAQSCLTLCNPMDCSMPGFPVHHQFPELAHTHVHWVGDAIQPSHPLSFSSPPVFNLSQHRGLF